MIDEVILSGKLAAVFLIIYALAVALDSMNNRQLAYAAVYISFVVNVGWPSSYIFNTLQLSVLKYHHYYLRSNTIDETSQTVKIVMKNDAKLTIYDILSSKDGYYEFLKYLIQEFALESLLFVTEIVYFKQKFIKKFEKEKKEKKEQEEKAKKSKKHKKKTKKHNGNRLRLSRATSMPLDMPYEPHDTNDRKGAESDTDAALNRVDKKKIDLHQEQNIQKQARMQLRKQYQKYLNVKVQFQTCFDEEKKEKKRIAKKIVTILKQKKKKRRKRMEKNIEHLQLELRLVRKQVLKKTQQKQKKKKKMKMKIKKII